MKIKLIHLIIILSIIALQGCTPATYEIYVSPDGDDSSNGQLPAPVASVQRAAELAREKAGKLPVTVFLRQGVYTLSEPLELNTEDSGTDEAPVQWKAMPGEKPVLSGGIIIKSWEQDDDGTWSAELPSDIKGKFRSFYVNGKPAIRARYPDDTYLRIEKAGKDNRTNFFFTSGDIPKIKNIDGLELAFLHDWSVSRIAIKSIDWKNNHLFALDTIGTVHKLTDWEPHPRYYLENARDFCDSPGEWYCDFNLRRIYYHPLPEENINNMIGIVPVTQKLVTIRGNKTNHAKFISFENIIFENTGWEIPGKGYCGVQASWFTDRQVNKMWNKLPAAIELDFADNCIINKCTIRNLGNSGIWIRENCHNCEISNSHIHHISANGINIGEGSDRLVGGKPWWKSVPEEISKNNKVTGCLIENCGTQFYGSIGIWCGLTSNTVIEYNEVRNLPYTGISIGWIWSTEPSPCKENTVHANHIHHIMNTLSDGGGIYALGLQPGSTLTNNLIHDVPLNAGRAESNGIFSDEGCSGFLLGNNIIYNIARSPLRFHKATNDSVRNNILVCGDGIQPIRYNRTKEEEIIKTDNIILKQSSTTDQEYLHERIKKRISEIKAGVALINTK